MNHHRKVFAWSFGTVSAGMTAAVSYLFTSPGPGSANTTIYDYNLTQSIFPNLTIPNITENLQSIASNVTIPTITEIHHYHEVAVSEPTPLSAPFATIIEPFVAEILQPILPNYLQSMIPRIWPVVYHAISTMLFTLLCGLAYEYVTKGIGRKERRNRIENQKAELDAFFLKEKNEVQKFFKRNAKNYEEVFRAREESLTAKEAALTVRDQALQEKEDVCQTRAESLKLKEDALDAVKKLNTALDKNDEAVQSLENRANERVIEAQTVASRVKNETIRVKEEAVEAKDAAISACTDAQNIRDQTSRLREGALSEMEAIISEKESVMAMIKELKSIRAETSQSGKEAANAKGAAIAAKEQAATAIDQAIALRNEVFELKKDAVEMAQNSKDEILALTNNAIAIKNQVVGIDKELSATFKKTLQANQKALEESAQKMDDEAMKVKEEADLLLQNTKEIKKEVDKLRFEVDAAAQLHERNITDLDDIHNSHKSGLEDIVKSNKSKLFEEFEEQKIAAREAVALEAQPIMEALATVKALHDGSLATFARLFMMEEDPVELFSRLKVLLDKPESKLPLATTGFQGPLDETKENQAVVEGNLTLEHNLPLNLDSNPEAVTRLENYKLEDDLTIDYDLKPEDFLNLEDELKSIHSTGQENGLQPEDDLNPPEDPLSEISALPLSPEEPVPHITRNLPVPPVDAIVTTDMSRCKDVIVEDEDDLTKFALEEQEPAAVTIWNPSLLDPVHRVQCIPANQFPPINGYKFLWSLSSVLYTNNPWGPKKPSSNPALVIKGNNKWVMDRMTKGKWKPPSNWAYDPFKGYYVEKKYLTKKPIGPGTAKPQPTHSTLSSLGASQKSTPTAQPTKSNLLPATDMSKPNTSTSSTMESSMPIFDQPSPLGPSKARPLFGENKVPFSWGTSGAQSPQTSQSNKSASEQRPVPETNKPRNTSQTPQSNKFVFGKTSVMGGNKAFFNKSTPPLTQTAQNSQSSNIIFGVPSIRGTNKASVNKDTAPLTQILHTPQSVPGDKKVPLSVSTPLPQTPQTTQSRNVVFGQVSVLGGNQASFGPGASVTTSTDTPQPTKFVFGKTSVLGAGNAQFSSGNSGSNSKDTQLKPLFAFPDSPKPSFSFGSSTQTGNEAKAPLSFPVPPHLKLDPSNPPFISSSTSSSNPSSMLGPKYNFGGPTPPHIFPTDIGANMFSQRNSGTPAIRTGGTKPAFDFGAPPTPEKPKTGIGASRFALTTENPFAPAPQANASMTSSNTGNPFAALPQPISESAASLANPFAHLNQPKVDHDGDVEITGVEEEVCSSDEEEMFSVPPEPQKARRAREKKKSGRGV